MTCFRQRLRFSTRILEIIFRLFRYYRKRQVFIRKNFSPVICWTHLVFAEIKVDFEFKSRATTRTNRKRPKFRGAETDRKTLTRARSPLRYVALDRYGFCIYFVVFYTPLNTVAGAFINVLFGFFFFLKMYFIRRIDNVRAVVACQSRRRRQSKAINRIVVKR